MTQREARYEGSNYVHPKDGTPGWWLVRGWKNGFLVRAPSAQEAYVKVRDRIVNPSTTGVEWLGRELEEVVDLGSLR